MVLGIPRSLFYHYFFPFWSTLAEELGVEYIVSPPTDRAILARGLGLVLDEFCLPVKIHFGHLSFLAERADFLFSPGFGRWGRRGYFCPKLMGLPDLAGHRFPRTLRFWHDLGPDGLPRPEEWRRAAAKIKPSISRRTFQRAWRLAGVRQREFQDLWARGYTPPECLAHLRGGVPLPDRGGQASFRVAVLGHPYLVYDALASQGIPELLARMGGRVITKEMLPLEADSLWPFQRKRVYWPLGQEILAAARELTAAGRIDGIVFLSACLCGPDAILGELLESYLGADENAPPLLKLIADEHTSRAGVITRTEAFVDMIAWRRKHAAL